MANSANGFAQTIVNANLVTARAYTNTSTTAANNYAGVMANGALAAANQAGVVANNANTFAGTTYVKKSGDIISGDLVIQGSLTTSGVVTYANTQTLLIGDNLIILNADIPNTIFSSENAGIEVNRGLANSNAAITFIESAAAWAFTSNTSNAYTTYIASNTDVESVAQNTTSAFGVANGSFNFANAVSTRSSASFGVANAAFNSANAISVTTSAAFGVANASFNSANNVAPQIAPAFNTANAAFGFANGVATNTTSSFGVANAAFGFANGVATNTTSSFGVANAAFNSANAISVTTSAAFGVANASFNAANAEYNVTNTAFGVANAAFDKANSSAPLTGTGASGTWGISITGSASLTSKTVTGTNEGNLVEGSMADTDQFRIRIGGTASDSGWAEIATADNGTEPIYVRQYTGVFTTVARTLTLLDGSGNSLIPGNLYCNSNIVAYYSSDQRLKENVIPIDNALSKVMQIRGVNFDWTDDYLKDQTNDEYFTRKHDVGVIAQEIEKVLPEAVATRSDGIKAVRYEKIVPLLIEAIKELKQEVELLKSKGN
jgi:hypothetical protein